MELSVVIPTCDRGAIFDQTIDHAVKATSGIECEILVVDDSRERSLDAGSLPSGISLLRNPGSGAASARNFGASRAQGKYLLFLDDDILISKESVLAMLELHRTTPGLILNPDWTYTDDMQHQLQRSSFGRFMHHHGLDSFRGWYQHPRWKERAMFETPVIASFHLSLERDLFRKSGGYNETFPLAGYEDYDFPKRLYDAGHSMHIDTRILVRHNEWDRINIRSWLIRQRNGGHTRRWAVRQGYDELALRYGGLRSALLTGLTLLKPGLLMVISIFGRLSFLDPLVWKIIDSLQAAAIFEGYNLGNGQVTKNQNT
jgi:glycosyltransferase involved in cell wall biosynthesis